jgi:Ca2+-binding RTX toxin-like protein
MRHSPGRGLSALLVVLLAVALAPAAALGAGGGEEGISSEPSRLDPDLAALEAAFDAGGPVAATALAAERRLFVRGGIVEVEVLTDGSDAAVAGAVRAAGGLVVVTMPGFVGAEVPLGRLTELSRGRGVLWVQSPTPVYPEAVNTSQALPVMDVDDWHAAGYRGEGVDVAVVDSGFKNRVAARNNGDLPNPLLTKNYCDAGLDGSGSGTIHGTAVAEVVYDIAPEADLWLVCIDNSLDLAKAITWMGQNGIDVFNASLGFIAAYPGDGTGQLKTYSAKAEKNGITWVNSAGNYGLNHWGGAFTDTEPDGLHQFAGTDERFSITLAANYYIQVMLRWDDTWPYAANDFDLYLYQKGNPVPLAVSDQCQGGLTLACSGPPKEQLYYNNGATAIEVEIEVRRGSGTSTSSPYLDVFFLPTDQQYVTPLDAVVPAGSLNDASTVAKVLSVGAANWDPVTWSAGVWKAEDFSSRGPTRAGLTKPDVAGYDGVDTFGYPYSWPSGPFGFFGTSAAAPHATGLAVLLLQANPDFTPVQLRAAVKSHTVNVAPAGVDNLTGKGRIMLGAPPAWPTCSGKAATILGSGDADEISGTAGADVIVAFGGADQIESLDGNDTVCAGGGDDEVLGGAGADVIYGGSGNDQLDGAGGNDQLYGEAGDDQLEGGPGTDTVSGGDGTDTCVGENRDTCEP